MHHSYSFFDPTKKIWPFFTCEQALVEDDQPQALTQSQEQGLNLVPNSIGAAHTKMPDLEISLGSHDASKMLVNYIVWSFKEIWKKKEKEILMVLR